MILCGLSGWWAPVDSRAKAGSVAMVLAGLVFTAIGLAPLVASLT